MFLLEVFSSQQIYRLTVVVLAALVLLTLVSQFGQYLYLELTTHFRLQYVVGAVCCAVVLSTFQSWKFVPVAVLCALLNATYLVPYYRAAPNYIDSPSRMQWRLLHFNVLKNNRNYDGVINLVRRSRADFVVLQEITDSWEQPMRALDDSYPYSKIVPRPHGAGMAVLSRHKFHELQVIDWDNSQHLAIFARVDVNDHDVSVLSLHPTTPVTPVKFKNRNLQFREAANLLKSFNGPRVLIGDLNVTPWSPYFVELLRVAGLRDARVGFGLQTSWPMPLPAVLRLPIDHCLVSDELKVEDIRIGPSIHSDHLPLQVDLHF